MTTKDDGGPAYPVPYQLQHNREGGMLAGLSLRDYFAAAAFQGIAASDAENNFNIDQLAKLAYESADAMLEARKK